MAFDNSNKTPANWIVQTSKYHISDKGSVKLFDVQGKLVGNSLMPSLMEFIAHNSAAIVELYNSNEYQQVIAQKSQNKADTKLAMSLAKQIATGQGAQALLESLGYTKK